MACLPFGNKKQFVDELIHSLIVKDNGRNLTNWELQTVVVHSQQALVYCRPYCHFLFQVDDRETGIKSLITESPDIETIAASDLQAHFHHTAVNRATRA